GQERPPSPKASARDGENIRGLRRSYQHPTIAPSMGGTGIHSPLGGVHFGATLVRVSSNKQRNTMAITFNGPGSVSFVNMFALCAVGVVLVALHVLAGFTRRLTAGQPGRSSKELLGVVVIGGGHFVARGLDGAVFEDLDRQFVDLHGL